MVKYLIYIIFTFFFPLRVLSSSYRRKSLQAPPEAKKVNSAESYVLNTGKSLDFIFNQNWSKYSTTTFYTICHLFLSTTNAILKQYVFKPSFRFRLKVTGSKKLLLRNLVIRTENLGFVACHRLVNSYFFSQILTFKSPLFSISLHSP